MSMIINNKFNIEDLVYLKTDTLQDKRIVVSIKVSKSELLYELGCGSSSSDHYEFEITSERDQELVLGINQDSAIG